MSFLAWIYGDSEAKAQAAADADARIREINAQSAARGRYTQDAQDRIERNYSTQNTIGVRAQEEEINGAFGEGWNDGKKNVTGFISGTFKVIGDGLSSVLLGIPFWAWALAAVGLWGWLGFPGLNALKKKLA